MTAYRRCCKAFAATIDGRQVVTREGDPVPADSPLAAQFPDFFEDLDEYAEREVARRGRAGDAGPVEQATAAPGERRATPSRRAPRKTPEPAADEPPSKAATPPPPPAESEV